MRTIDGDALLEKFAKLEAIALEYVGKLNEQQNPDEHERWVMWTAILNERTAYKYEIVDAPTVDAVPVRHGKWIPFDLTWGRTIYSCSVCKDGCDVDVVNGIPIYAYCPNCGARMDEERKEE